MAGATFDHLGTFEVKMTNSSYFLQILFLSVFAANMGSMMEIAERSQLLLGWVLMVLFLVTAVGLAQAAIAVEAAVAAAREVVVLPVQVMLTETVRLSKIFLISCWN